MSTATTMLVVGALTAGIAVAAVTGPVAQCDGTGDENSMRKKCEGTGQNDWITGNEYGETIKALASEDVVYLGHVFDDGPREAGGWRWCMNSVALNLERRWG